MQLEALLLAIRPRQWIKNLVVFAAPIFALRFDGASFLLATGAFAAFTLTSGAAYLLNDVADVRADRQHPTKRARPIAAGRLSAPVALVAAAIILLSGLALAFGLTWYLGLAVSGFAILQGAYSLAFKREPVLDVMSIATGYVLRALGGAAAVRVPVSGWFLLCLWLLALYIAIEKRKVELLTIGNGVPSRAVLQTYSLSWLHRLEIVVTASALMSYALWAIGRTVLMLATVPLVAYGLFKYQLLVEQEHEEAPERLLFRTVHIPLTIAIWLLATVAILALSQQGRLPTRWINL